MNINKDGKNMPTRHEIRETAFILCFEELFWNGDIDELFDIAKSFSGLPVNDDVKSLVKGVLEKKDELDAIIAKYSDKRSVDRIPKLNLAILRIAIYESLYCDRVPVNVAISEAVTLARAYSYDTDVSFINGVLGSFSRDPEVIKND